MIRIRSEQQERERLDAERKIRTAKRKEEKAVKDAEKAAAVGACTWVPLKRGRKPKQVVTADAVDLVVVVDLESTPESVPYLQEEEEKDGLIILPAPQVTRRSSRRPV